MRRHSLFLAAALAVALSLGACDKSGDRHDDLKLPKEISVGEEGWHVGWEKTTVQLSIKSNCYWGVEFLTWQDQVLSKGDTTRVMTPARWLSTPALYGNGDATLTVSVDENARSRTRRTGYIKVYTGDKDVYSLIPLVQDGNPDYVPPVVPPLDLRFDFTHNDMGWPTESQSVGEVIYPLDGVGYAFYFGRCNIGAYLVVHDAGAYLGLPAIEDYRLTSVTVLVSSNNSKTRTGSIVADPEGKTVVGAAQVWPALPNAEVVYNLKETEVNTRYYLLCGGSGLPIAGLTLHYESIESGAQGGSQGEGGGGGSVSLRIGSYNMRVSSGDSGTVNEWSQRKTRFKASVEACDFDVFGLQEVTATQQTWLVSELGQKYTFRFFSPYSSDGAGRNAQGIAYKTDLFSCSDWHFFWAADNPDVMSTTDGTYNRGGCCCLLTHTGTGIPIFVMSNHGCLNAESNARYAHVYVDREKLRNSGGAASFFFGDMNTQPSAEEGTPYVTYTSHWLDPYVTVPESNRTGPENSLNSFEYPEGKPDRRIDYIFYRGDNVSVNHYTCDNTLYDGKFASDHFPIYIDVVIDE